MIERKVSLKDTGLFTTGAFAKRAGVTVRTLRYYDRTGLLQPHGRTPSGQRLYGSPELVRLQQILTLKFIGFQLKEIRRILDSPNFDLRAALLAQRSTITDKAKQIQAVIRAIDAAFNTLAGGKIEWDKFAGIIREVQMEKNQEFLKKYYTEEQLKSLAERGKNFTAADQVKVSAEWEDIYTQAKKLAAKGADPAGKEAQALAARAQHMIDLFTGGDKGIETGLSKFYADKENHPPAWQNLYPKLDEKTGKSYAVMMKAFKEKQGTK